MPLVLVGHDVQLHHVPGLHNALQGLGEWAADVSACLDAWVLFPAGGGGLRGETGEVGSPDAWVLLSGLGWA